MNTIRFRGTAVSPVRLDCSGGKERTKQSFKEQCDINHIMSRYLRSGNVDHLAKHGPQYMIVEPLTFHECMNIVRKAEEMFNDLPSKLRRRFGGEPANFLEFVQNPENLAEMRELGLALPERTQDLVQKVHVVSSDLEPSSKGDPPEGSEGAEKAAPSKKSAKPTRTRST